ncbi:hypothetical protein GL213_11970 [Halogeometricum borinquense]|uniref:Restriction endonuclease type IV Mrr domain-containing protein n=1 Tax=Halogeometricum borinquense TaxID=60847 RepID=A0A6C0UKC1_9EURY|nr:restriction endonuclease [Halogeometricum borinquense]QIB73418.1 hypothetical protein G3I44_03440 [Halogeometricum borinquense]QIQ77181.1 hypothetical protein GL213_11970 [Halogeometricum borinquense]
MDKLPELEPDAFVSFLEDLWNERGWDTSVKQRPDETFFIIGKRGDGKRGVLYVFPTVESHVKEKHMKQFVGFCRKKGIDVGVVATQGAYAGPSRQIAESKGIHLLDRETLAGTVKEGGFEDILAEYTGGSGGPIGAVLATLQSYGVPVPDTLPFDLPSFDTQAIIARLPIGDDADASGEGESVGEPQQGGFDSSADGDGDSESSLPGPLTSIPRPNIVLPVALLLLIVFLVGSAVGPTLGLPVIGGGSGGTSGDAVSVSALSTAGANATAEVRWNSRTTKTLTVNGTTYTAPENETFVLVRMNVTNHNESPMSFGQSSLALEVAGERYGYQPLNGTTGFAEGGLFAPNDPREVWLAFTVPTDATSGTLVLRDDDLAVRFVHDSSIEPEATEPSP